jgi:hypothetical protein
MSKFSFSFHFDSNNQQITGDTKIKYSMKVGHIINIKHILS